MKKLLIIVLVVFLAVLFLILQQKANVSFLLPSKDSIQVSIDDISLQEESIKLVYSTTLRPRITILYSSTIDNLNLFIDDSENVLGNEFYGETSVEDTKVSFQPGYALKPGIHNIKIEYEDYDSSIKSLNFIVSFSFKDDFDTLIENSKVWLVPKGSSNQWFNVRNGKLFIEPKTKDNHASLVFLYPVINDATVDFELTPLGKNISLVLYFLDSTRNEFVIGSNDNKRFLLFHRTGSFLKDTIFGKELKIKDNSRYHVRLVKKESTYQLAIKELDLEEKFNPDINFVVDNLVLQYLDNDQAKSTPEQVGFALWQNSSGVVIDNFSIKPDSIMFLR